MAKPLSADQERALGVELFNRTWDLLDRSDRTREQDDEMLHMAHASRHHWGRVSEPVNLARGEWQCSRVYAVLGRPEPALHHARRVLELCQEYGIGDFDLAFGHEALARGYAVAGDLVAAAEAQAQAAAVPIAGEDDRAAVLADLRTIPGPAADPGT